MSIDSRASARILLKARPTPEQLADRTADPVPDGLELYLDAADISGDDWYAPLRARIEALRVPRDFTWVVEGPLRSLDGTFFDISRPTEANLEVLRRVVSFGGAIGAQAAVIHVIALAETDEFSAELNQRTLDASLPLLGVYADLCARHGLVATIENVPPVMKMREERVMHSLIGMEPRDLEYLVQCVDGLRVTFDTSHAQLYLNAANLDPAEAPIEVRSMVRFLNGRREVATLDEYIDRIGPLVEEAHFSNAEGLFGEGLAYDDGELDLDRAASRLGLMARFLVTETIEVDPNRAVLMREAQARMSAAVVGAGQRVYGEAGR